MAFNRTISLAAFILVIAVTADGINNFKGLDLFLNPHSGVVSQDASSIKCTFCKYSVQFLCNAFLVPGHPSSDVFWSNITMALTDVCQVVVPAIGIDPNDCPGLIGIALGQVVDAVDTKIAPNLCKDLYSDCPANSPTCVSPDS
ncbi:hypothetical protein M3Y97_00407200 [Aphelenchoides bicaudatus]|nr:hypothetical protein M3Y97_00407200 [Aphelenchoides bicaudatus]